MGIALTLLTKWFPKHEKYIPSAAGMGLAWIFQWYYAMLFFVGGFIAWRWKRQWPKNGEEYLYPIASGVIAGGSLMGVALIFWENGGEMAKLFRQILGH